MNKSEVGDDEEEGTSWHGLLDDEIDELLAELNERLQARGLRTRFRVSADNYGWDVMVCDGGDSEVVDTVEEAEDIVEELCGE